uniref:Uncharacterized protein n=1 Tax=Globodera rostochiensis TaxID=31243 RepID=A0A914HRC3_GLORO
MNAAIKEYKALDLVIYFNYFALDFEHFFFAQRFVASDSEPDIQARSQKKDDNFSAKNLLLRRYTHEESTYSFLKYAKCIGKKKNKKRECAILNWHKKSTALKQQEQRKNVPGSEEKTLNGLLSWTSTRTPLSQEDWSLATHVTPQRAAVHKNTVRYNETGKINWE